MTDYIYNIYDYIFSNNNKEDHSNEPNIFYNLIDEDLYTYVFNFDIITITKDKINKLNKSFINLQKFIKDNIDNILIAKFTKKYILDMDINKKINKIELFRLLNIYCRWTTKYSINTKVVRIPDLEDALIGCLFIYYAISDTTVINDNNFDNAEYSNSIMNIITYINTINTYNKENMIPEYSDIINSLSLN
jgi:hypothetical protein